MSTAPNTAALRDLLERVEAGKIGQWYNWSSGIKSHGDLAKRAYNGSLDSAKALHDAVLPPCNQYTIDEGPSGCGANIVIWPYGLSGELEFETNGYAETSARAWLIAILRAIIDHDTK